MGHAADQMDEQPRLVALCAYTHSQVISLASIVAIRSAVFEGQITRHHGGRCVALVFVRSG